MSSLALARSACSCGGRHDGTIGFVQKPYKVIQISEVIAKALRNGVHHD
jgi:hypothetical protein